MKDIPECFLDPISNELLFSKGVKIFTAEDGYTYTEKTIKFLRKQAADSPIASPMVPGVFIGFNLIEGNRALRQSYEAWGEQRAKFENARKDLDSFSKGKPALDGICALNVQLESENDRLCKELQKLGKLTVNVPPPIRPVPPPPIVPAPVPSIPKTAPSRVHPAVQSLPKAVSTSTLPQGSPSPFFSTPSVPVIGSNALQSVNVPVPSKLSNSVSLPNVSVPPIMGVKASANGFYTAVARQSLSSGICRIQVYITMDLQNPDYEFEMGYTVGQPFDFVPSNDGAYVAQAVNGEIKLYQSSKTQTIALGAYVGDIPNMQFSPDSSILAAAGINGEKTGITIFSDLQQAKPNSKRIGYRGPAINDGSQILSMQFTPNGVLSSLQLFYDASKKTYQSRLCLWDIESGWCTPYEFEKGFSPSQIVYQSDAQDSRFVLKDRQHEVCLCDASSFDDRRGIIRSKAMPTSIGLIRQMDLSADGKYLAVLEQGSIKTFKLTDNGDFVSERSLPGNYDRVFFNKDELVYHAVNSTTLEQGFPQKPRNSFNRNY